MHFITFAIKILPKKLVHTSQFAQKQFAQTLCQTTHSTQQQQTLPSPLCPLFLPRPSPGVFFETVHSSNQLMTINKQQLHRDALHPPQNQLHTHTHKLNIHAHCASAHIYENAKKKNIKSNTTLPPPHHFVRVPQPRLPFCVCEYVQRAYTSLMRGGEGARLSVYICFFCVLCVHFTF